MQWCELIARYNNEPKTMYEIAVVSRRIFIHLQDVKLRARVNRACRLAIVELPDNF
jgi:hypothetical protein